MSPSEPLHQSPSSVHTAVFADAVADAYDLAASDRLASARRDHPYGSASPLPLRLRALLVAALAVARDAPATPSARRVTIATLQASLARWDDAADSFYGGLLVGATADLLAACHPATAPGDAHAALHHACDYLNAIRVEALGGPARHW